MNDSEKGKILAAIIGNPELIKYWLKYLPASMSDTHYLTRKAYEFLQVIEYYDKNPEKLK